VHRVWSCCSSGMASFPLPSLTVTGARENRAPCVGAARKAVCTSPFFPLLILFTCLFRATSLAALLTDALICGLLHWSNSTTLCGPSTAVHPAPSALSARTFLLSTALLTSTSSLVSITPLESAVGASKVHSFFFCDQIFNHPQGVLDDRC